MISLLMKSPIRVSPYPSGKTFAFTIVDDTDGCTLEMIRPIYDFLARIGLRTTKTVWVKPPSVTPTDFRDQGDTLERGDYVDYLKGLRDQGFEIALHNVSSKTTRRAEIIEGLETFKRVLGAYPLMNVHHEKNAENLYFDIAQDSSILPIPFYSKLFKSIYLFTKAALSGGVVTRRYQGLQGEVVGSEYFWGDICKENIKYIRTNIFLNDLNVLKCNPRMPYVLSETPFVNYWFDSADGQDARTFNAIMTSKNILRLKSEMGGSILYTHFGKGFVERKGDCFELNQTTKNRLGEMASDSNGWFVPASQLLDRLLLLQKVHTFPVRNGMVVINHNPEPVRELTLWCSPNSIYYDNQGDSHQADRQGRIILPELRSESALVVSTKMEADWRYWRERSSSRIGSDMKTLISKISRKILR